MQCICTETSKTTRGRLKKNFRNSGKQSKVYSNQINAQLSKSQIQNCRKCHGIFTHHCTTPPYPILGMV